MSHPLQLAPEHRWAYYIFRLEIAKSHRRCSECGKLIRKGEQFWASRYERGSRYGNIAKGVCSESCGQDFDLEMMENQARQHGR